jgi:hypothetical protein
MTRILIIAASVVFLITGADAVPKHARHHKEPDFKGYAAPYDFIMKFGPAYDWQRFDDRCNLPSEGCDGRYRNEG